MEQRQSNIELLRIILMLMIVVGHANFISLAPPDNVCSGLNVSRIFLQSIVEVAVDCFVLISGYFGIRASLKGFGNLIFQILFYFFGIYLIAFLLTGHTTTVEFLNAINMTRSEWFVKAYICLYILSPVLNAFTEKVSMRIQGEVLLCFYLYAFIYGWIGGGSRFFLQGYTPLAFIGLYLLGNYFRRSEGVSDNGYIKMLKWKPIVYLSLYLITVSLGALVCCFIFAIKPGVDVYWAIYSYISPLMVGGGFFYFSHFQNSKFHTAKLSTC